MPKKMWRQVKEETFSVPGSMTSLANLKAGWALDFSLMSSRSQFYLEKNTCSLQSGMSCLQQATSLGQGAEKDAASTCEDNEELANKMVGDDDEGSHWLDMHGTSQGPVGMSQSQGLALGLAGSCTDLGGDGRHELCLLPSPALLAPTGPQLLQQRSAPGCQTK